MIYIKQISFLRQVVLFKQITFTRGDFFLDKDFLTASDFFKQRTFTPGDFSNKDDFSQFGQQYTKPAFLLQYFTISPLLYV